MKPVRGETAEAADQPSPQGAARAATQSTRCDSDTGVTFCFPWSCLRVSFLL